MIAETSATEEEFGKGINGATMNDYLELRSLFKAIRRRWWLIVLTTVLLAALGYAVSIRQTPVYQATTSLLVGRSIQNAADIDRYDLETGWQLAQTYADIAKRQPVLQRTVDELGLEVSWSELRNRVRTGVSDRTQLMEIQVEASSPAAARLIADEIALQLILLSPSGDKTLEQIEVSEFAAERIETLQEKIRTGQQQLEKLEADLLNTTATEKSAQLLQQVATLNNLIGTWEGNYLQLLSVGNPGSQSNDLAILEPAQGSDSPVRPRPLVNVLVAALVGMVLGVGMIFLLDLFDHSLRTPEEVAQALGLTTVGAIPPIRGKHAHDTLVVNHDPFSPAFESYRLLRSKIQFMAVEHHGRTVMITSPGHSEGKSLTAANLGIVTAQAGLRTVLIDANLREPVLHDLFQVSNDQGVTHLLRGKDRELDQYLHATLVPNLKVLPSGAKPSNPSELLGSSRMSYVLAELASTYDVIICDTPESVTVADASVLSSKVDGVLLVIDAGDTDRTSAIQALTNLRDAGATMLGCVLNRSGAKQSTVALARTAPASVTPKEEHRKESLTYAESVR